MWSVYLIICRDANFYYVGISRNLEQRIKQHSSLRGAEFVKRHGFYHWVVVKDKIMSEAEAKNWEKNTILSLRSGIIGIVCGAGWTVEKFIK